MGLRMLGRERGVFGGRFGSLCGAGLGLREMWSRAERLAGVSLLGVSGADEKRAWDLGLGRHAAE